MPSGRSKSPTETLGDYSRTEAPPLTPQISNASAMSAPYFSPRQQHQNLRMAGGSNNSLRSLSASHGDRADQTRHGHTPSTSSTGIVSGNQTTTRPSGPRHIASATLRPEKQSRSASDTTPARGEGSSGSGNGDGEREQGRDGKASNALTHRTSRSGLSARASRSGRATPHTLGHGSTNPNGTTPHLPSSSARVRLLPHLPHSKDTEVAPTVQMYWSKAPVWGTMPNHGMRAHSVTLVDSVAWIFGGCDERGCWKDLWLFNTETMQWSHPEVQGDIPPPCRAHTATLVDRKIVIFGGGEGPVYYDTVYVLDTVHRRWQKVEFPADAPHPTTRRAHTAVYYDGKIWVFGGGNGSQALNDVWTLTVNCPVEKMRWSKVEIRGSKQPSARGYHTANLVRNIMIVVGGSDGRECFSDIWCLNLDTLRWDQVRLETTHRRLSHSVTQVGSYLFIMGGHDGNSYSSDILFFNLVSLAYETKAVAGQPLSARGYHVSLLADSRIFVFGGFNGQDVYEDVHILDLAGSGYLAQVTSFQIDLDQ